jgi:hypothetical protein
MICKKASCKCFTGGDGVKEAKLASRHRLGRKDMSHDPQHEIWNPFGERVDSLSATERAEIEIGQAWAYYARGGGGDPRYFDYYTYIRNVERER